MFRLLYFPFFARYNSTSKSKPVNLLACKSDLSIDWLQPKCWTGYDETVHTNRLHSFCN